MSHALRTTLSIALILLLGLAAYSTWYYFTYPQETRLKVNIIVDSKVQIIYDDELNETYDYSHLLNSNTRIDFSQVQNRSDFAKGNINEIYTLNLTNIHGVYEYVRSLGVPNIVAGVSSAMLNETYDEVYAKIYGNSSEPYGNGISKSLGTKDGIHYEVTRESAGIINDGVSIFKYYGPSDSSARSYAWILLIDRWPASKPYFRVSLTKYP